MPTNRQEVLAAVVVVVVAVAKGPKKDAAQLPRHSRTVNVVYWKAMLTVRLCLGGCQLAYHLTILPASKPASPTK